ncbi:MAG: (2Fe-2S)-binding protein [Pseudomonadales bacterium]
MYVCVCNAVRDTQIREAVQRGCNELDDLTEELGVGNACGTCVEYARALLESQLEAQLEGQLEQSTDNTAFYAA